MPSYFISDLHLSSETPLLTEGFLRFTNALSPNDDTLYILGDLFEVWVGDDDDDPYANDIQRFLKEKTQSGLKIFFMAGNRDLLIGQRFANNTGVRLLTEPTQIALAGKNVLLLHGDSLCTLDKGYMVYRKIVRNAFLQRLALLLPLKKRREMIGGLRSKSAEMNAQKSMTIMDVVQSEVNSILAKYDADILLHGHTHRPARHPMGDKERIVLGDWGRTAQYLKVENDSIELLEYAVS